MGIHTLEITDIYKSAYFLTKGSRLQDISVENHGRRIATFRISGKHLMEHDREYRSGHAMVNPLQLRESINYLRDILFETLREYDGRKTHDRKRKKRSYQTWR